MNNIEEFNGADFGNFLLKSNLVAAGKEKFMVHWCRKFFEFRVQLPKMSWPEQLPLYLKNLYDLGDISGLADSPGGSSRSPLF